MANHNTSNNAWSGLGNRTPYNSPNTGRKLEADSSAPALRWGAGLLVATAVTTSALIGVNKVSEPVVNFFTGIADQIGSGANATHGESAELPAMSVDLDANTAEVRSENKAANA